MRRHLSTARLTILVCVLLPAAALLAQDGPPPRAQVTPILEQESAAPGSTVRTAVRVSLPEGLHANAHKPRDPSLIPVVLTVNAPSGVTVEEIVYPEPTDLRQENAPQPLSVYEREFVIGAVLRIAAECGSRASRDPVAAPLPGVQREAVLPADYRAVGVDRAGWRGRQSGARQPRGLRPDPLRHR